MAPQTPVVAGEPTSVLDQVEILRPLPAQLKAQLEAHLTERTVRGGQVIFNEGDPGDAMYLIVSGEVSVFLTDRALGLSCELARLGPGQVFGEMAIITGSPRSATVKAMEEAKLKVLTRDILFKLVQAAPQVGLMIAAVLAKRTEDLNKTQWLEFGSLKGRTLDPSLVDLLPLALVRKHRIAPVARGQGTVTVATPDPSNRVGLEDVRELLVGEKVRVLAVPEPEFAAWLLQYFSGTAPSARAVPKTSLVSQAAQVNYISAAIEREDENRLSAAAANNQDVALLASTILLEGIDRGASDIHIEPDRKGITVRYRIDGNMVPRESIIPKSLLAPLVSRLKILGSLNITERRMPQDGRISLEVQGRGFDLRMATVPTRFGEKITLRILDSSSIKQSVSQLIGAEKVATVVKKLFSQPTGLVLVTGPTGSGKTTTLYAALRERMAQPISICTVEDPIEYDLPGVTQVQVNDAQGLGFSEVVRAFMRTNPDVIFVGEMRDTVTAKLACNAALTGHMVLSSLHTNDALSAITRLQSMGVENYVVASSLLGLINQRLVRRICPNCRTETVPPESVLSGLTTCGIPFDPGQKFYKGRGCEKCGGTGVKGRVGLYELLVVSQKVRDAIAQGADNVTLRHAAMDGSYVSLARYAGFTLGQGVVEPSELLKVVPRDQGAAQA